MNGGTATGFAPGTAEPVSPRASVLQVAKAAGLFGVARRLTRKQLRILCYHGVWLGGPPHYGDCLFMSIERFVSRIELLQRLGYPVLPLDEAVSRLADGTLPDCAVAITIDDGWYSTAAAMLPVLKRYRMPATVYVTTYYALARRPVLNVLLGFMLARCEQLPPPEALPEAARALMPENRFPGEEDRQRIAAALSDHLDRLPALDARWGALERLAQAFRFDLGAVLADRRFDLMTEDEIRAMRHDGFDVQLHTHSHRMHDFVPARLREEIVRNRKVLAVTLGENPETFTHFCYPSGVYHEKVFGVLREQGIRSATTTEFGLNPRGSEPLALRRILDCESHSDLELEARLCGFWSLLSRAKHMLTALGSPRRRP
ncbi:polysaccharide deacetylase family protein [Aromatoleum buckelii]|uniref:Polysaccharide deacetylase family protein n=1 Tax=Aromatoleum buckelii TaxID=200254 RepID=A0ABX1N2U7_9RHOO|nr:polysaccharide deacetylase family protein [Aromatoleum buckelii]MCK0510743.1 polysaccharide deacetylase family protein [Aromatoleum buckelii]